MTIAFVMALGILSSNSPMVARSLSCQVLQEAGGSNSSGPTLRLPLGSGRKLATAFTHSLLHKGPPPPSRQVNSSKRKISTTWSGQSAGRGQRRRSMVSSNGSMSQGADGDHGGHTKAEQGRRGTVAINKLRKLVRKPSPPKPKT